MKIFIVLPCYNEAAALPRMLEKLLALQKKMVTDIHVIAVDDGSRDETPSILRQWSQNLSTTVISHQLNRGLGETIRDAFEAAARLSSPEDIIIRMDADNTHEPEYIPSMLEKLRQGYDIVIASRFQKGGCMIGVSGYRAFISRAANCFMKMVFPIPRVWDYSCGFRAYRASMIQEAISIFGNLFIDLKGLGFTCTVEKLIKLRMLNVKMAEVPFVLRYDQKEGDSKMLSSITTLGYFVLALKNFYPWGRHQKLLRSHLASLKR